MSIVLSFFGDFVASKSTDIVISNDVKNIISNSDLAVCNFEAPIEGDYVAFDREGPLVKQSSKSPLLLKDWGFNIIQLANNHMLDFGDEGCEASLNAFKDVTTVGAGTFDEAYRVKKIDVKGKTIGLLSCVHHEFGVWETERSNQKMGTAWIGHHLIQKRIRDTKNEVDYLFVLPHAGVEEIDAPLPEWRELYKSFIEWGADAVIGTHPHVPQGWEEYKGKPIFYSLGNYYFDFLTGSHPFWNKSLVIQLIIDEESSLKYNVHNIKFSEGKIDLDKSAETEKHNEYLCKMLMDNEVYIRYINEETIRLWYDYRNLLIRGIGAIPLHLQFKDAIKTAAVSLFKGRQKSLLENCLQCESHRWTILRAQRLLTNK